MKTKGARTMSIGVSDRDREEVLGELEAYYTDKLATVAAKRTNAEHSKPVQPREIVTGGKVSIRIDPEHQELVVSWGGK